MDLYPSRSEFCRIAIKNQLLKDLKLHHLIQEVNIMPKLDVKEFIKQNKLSKPTILTLKALREKNPNIIDYKYMNEELNKI